MTAVKHPKNDDKGNFVRIMKPSQATPLDSWRNDADVAIVTPGGQMPAELNGIPFTAWTAAPCNDDMWAKVDGQHGGLFDEPVFVATPGKRIAVGVVIEETDGRVWVVHPSNAYGGYQATFPKGTWESGGPLQGTAIKEAFEESGLMVAITGFLADSERSQSKTRYYLGRRVGGSPADMGWESQAVSLVPLAMLGDILTHANDAPLVEALQQEQRPARRDIIKYQFGLTSGFRILATLHGFHRKYGMWPHRLLMEKAMANAIVNNVLTPLGWQMLTSKLEIVAIDEGTVIAEGKDGASCDYNIDPCEQVPAIGPRADEWIWGFRIAN
jgi:ADP-ribose pyrophosphatase YjhB (NUDIX family)